MTGLKRRVIIGRGLDWVKIRQGDLALQRQLAKLGNFLRQRRKFGGLADGVVRGSEERQLAIATISSGVNGRAVNLCKSRYGECFGLGSSTYFSMMMTE